MEWISVKQKIPKAGDYLVSDGENVTVAYYDNIYGEWEASSFVYPSYEESKVILDFIIKFWMELPEPPKTD